MNCHHSAQNGPLGDWPPHWTISATGSSNLIPLDSARAQSLGHGQYRRQPPGPAHGLDIDEAGNGTASEQRLYQLIRQAKPIVDRTFAIEFLDAGVEAFTFG